MLANYFLFSMRNVIENCIRKQNNSHILCKFKMAQINLNPKYWFDDDSAVSCLSENR